MWVVTHKVGVSTTCIKKSLYLSKRKAKASARLMTNEIIWDTCETGIMKYIRDNESDHIGETDSENETLHFLIGFIVNSDSINKEFL